jgi:hypothetical protein
MLPKALFPDVRLMGRETVHKVGAKETFMMESKVAGTTMRRNHHNKILCLLILLLTTVLGTKKLSGHLGIADLAVNQPIDQH